jgi:esterase/lipase superfamily enzyme
MQRRHVELWAPGIEAHGVLLAYSHWGRPLLVFPSEGGWTWEYETGGMVDAITPLIAAGRLKLCCVDFFEEASWSNAAAPLEERARAHGRYEARILEQLVPWIHDDCGGAPEILTTGCSLGAYDAANFAWRAQMAHHVPRFCRDERDPR